MKLKESEQAPQALSMSPPRICSHQRMISNRVTEEEHGAGKVRCLECGSVIPDPHLYGEDKEWISAHLLER